MNYEDILYLSHPVSKKHKPMEIGIRSAQFAPFAALTGYGEAVEEVDEIMLRQEMETYRMIEHFFNKKYSRKYLYLVFQSRQELAA